MELTEVTRALTAMIRSSQRGMPPPCLACEPWISGVSRVRLFACREMPVCQTKYSPTHWTWRCRAAEAIDRKVQRAFVNQSLNSVRIEMRSARLHRSSWKLGVVVIGVPPQAHYVEGAPSERSRNCDGLRCERARYAP